MSSFDRATLRAFVKDVTGEIPDATVNRWIDFTNREVALAMCGDLQLENTTVTVGTTAYACHDVGVRAFSINSVEMLDASDEPEDANPLEEVTLDQLFAMMHMKTTSSEDRRPYWWANCGVSSDNTDRISFMIYPQATGGTYSTRKMRVNYYQIPQDLADDTEYAATQNLMMKATWEGVMRYAWLRNGDKAAYIAAEAEYQRSVQNARQTNLGKPIYGSRNR